MNLQAEPLHLKEATVTCIPRLRGGGGVGRRSRRGGGSAAAPPQVSSVLDRLRDVVLRLAMLSAATSTKQGTLRRSATATTPSRAQARVSPASAAPYADSYLSDAVDDCIEFLKRSAAGGAPAAAVEEEAASPFHHAPLACATPCEP